MRTIYSYFKKKNCRKKSKKFKPRPKGNMGFYNDIVTGPIGVLRPLKYVPENSMERLSVSESISKGWTTLKTEVVGGPSNSREPELKQIEWRQKRPLTTIGLN